MLALLGSQEIPELSRSPKHILSTENKASQAFEVLGEIHHSQLLQNPSS